MPYDTSVLVIQEFITEPERRQLEAIAFDYLERGILGSNPAGPLRYRCKFHGTEYCTPFIKSVADRVIQKLHLQDFMVDPYLGWIVSLIKPGGHIQVHVDAFPRYSLDGDKHLRCNFMVSSENESYNPVIGTTNVMVNERDMWCFFASDIQHGTQVVVGNKPRIVYQFGFSVPRGYSLQRYS
jgi:hypothetical protein